MSMEGWVGWCVAAVAATSIVLAWILHRMRMGGARKLEQASRPDALASARLLYMEKQFRMRDPVSLIARIDRAYQGADGTVALVELKTRWTNRAYATDVIQLSAQRMAVEGQTGLRVSEHAYVTVQPPTKSGARRSHKVELMEPSEIVALYRRREDILAGRASPRYAHSARACKGCAFRPRCDRPNK
jgi:CRISPR-associated exonuclease Cas4